MHETDLTKNLKPIKKEYCLLIKSIGTLLEQGRMQAYNTVNSILVKTYWEIGKNIVEYEQAGKARAEYGSALLDNLSIDLVEKF